MICQDGIFAVVSCAEAVQPSIGGSTDRTWHRRPRRHILRESGQSPKGRVILAGPTPLHDAGTLFCCSFSFFVPSASWRPDAAGGRQAPPRQQGGRPFVAENNAVVVVSLLSASGQAAGTWLNRTSSRSILKMLRRSIRATMIRATFVPRLAWARSKAGRYRGI